MAGVVPHVKFVQTLEDWEMVALHTVSCGSFVDLVFQFVCKEEVFDKGIPYSRLIFNPRVKFIFETLNAG